MLAIILGIGVLNLGLGFALAVWLENPQKIPQLAAPPLRWPFRRFPNKSRRTVSQGKLPETSSPLPAEPAAVRPEDPSRDPSRQLPAEPSPERSEAPTVPPDAPIAALAPTAAAEDLSAADLSRRPSGILPGDSSARDRGAEQPSESMIDVPTPGGSAASVEGTRAPVAMSSDEVGATAGRGTPPPSSELLSASRPVPAAADESSPGSWWSTFPEEWASLLRSNRIMPESFEEAMMWVIRLETPVSRQKLLSIEHRVRVPSGEAVTARDFQVHCETWVEQLKSWRTALSDAGLSAVREGLLKALDDQLVHLTPLYSSACDHALTPPGPELNALIARWVCMLAGSVSDLRDHVDELLGVALRPNGRWQESNDELRYDSLSGTMSRIGLESFAHDWLERDAERVRVVTGAVIDIRQCSVLNTQEGVQTTDRLIARVGGLLQDLVRKDRGCDRICRLRADVFVVVFGDTGLRNAINCTERIRQTIASTTFRTDQKALNIAVSCAVTEWQRTESLSQWLDRLWGLLDESKRSGGNQTCVGDESSTRIIPPGRTSMPARELSID